MRTLLKNSLRQLYLLPKKPTTSHLNFFFLSYNKSALLQITEH